MKKNFLLLSMIAVLTLVGCNQTNDTSKEDASKPVDPSSEPASEPASSQPSSSVVEEPTIITGDNFTVSIPKDLSMMSFNCKKYIDDMRTQQQKLIKEKGETADYYLNDLYGSAGVDITKGVLASTRDYQDNTGGYRDGVTQNDYLDEVGADWEKGEKSDENKGVNISFEPADSLKGKQYSFTYGLKEDLSDAKSVETSDTSVNLKNLLVNQKYYFKVGAEGKESSVLNFTTGDYPRWINARPMFNVRDHGGYMTSTGKRIKQGMVYRGGEINNKSNWYGTQRYTDDLGNTSARDGHLITQTDAAKKAFREDMGMVNGLEIDLRSSGETNGYSACGFAQSGDISYKLISISSYYKGMQQNTSQIKQCFEAFAQADEHPVYYHCYGGADRTGTVGFLLGALLGMSYTDLVIDFELTSYSSNPSRNYRGHLRNGPWNDWPGLVDYLKNTLGWGANKSIKDGAEDYLKSKCGVSQTTIDKIRDIMLED